MLSYYRPNGLLEVQCDSSQAGLGVTIRQGGHPITFETGALTNRVPLRMDRKGMLATVFVMEKFNDYTFGRKRVVFSNHKPLKAILKKPLHRTPKRLKGMINSFLRKYHLEVKYEKGNKIVLADTLSRAFIPADDQDESEFETINMIKYLPVSSIRRSSETLKRTNLFNC